MYMELRVWFIMPNEMCPVPCPPTRFPVLAGQPLCPACKYEPCDEREKEAVLTSYVSVVCASRHCMNLLVSGRMPRPSVVALWEQEVPYFEVKRSRRETINIGQA